MLTPGHLASSYVISQVPSFWGKPLTKKEVFLVIIMGYILDLDLLVAKFFGIEKTYHHLLPTHTPLFAVFLFVVVFIFLRRHFAPSALLLGGVALFSHLVLDDIGYWFYKLGLQEESSIPQIFWLYPFDPRRGEAIAAIFQERAASEAVRLYLTKAPVNVALETIFVILALLLYFSSSKIRDRTT